MPGKHVRFATHRIVYPTTPAPSSPSSEASSDGPITPPPIPFPLPVPQIYQSSSPRSPHHLNSPSSSHHWSPPGPHHVAKPHTTLHPLLVISQPRAVNYDITRHYSHVSTSYASLSSRPNSLSEPATSPPVIHLSISIPQNPAWRINVTPSLNGAYVTVSDVLRAVYYGLRDNLSHAEFYGLGKREMELVAAAYKARYRRIQSRTAYEEEKVGGVKRVDCFAGRTNFAGLSVGSRLGSWVLHTS